MQKHEAKKILISNDDGYGAPGVVTLFETLRQDYFCWSALPDRDRSGASQSLTLHRPIKITRVDDGIVVEGTPADCVKLSLSGLCDFTPDYVVSGINSGANLGTDVLYSGTVAAAMEGLCAGIPALAFSLTGTRYFDTAAYWVGKIMEIIIDFEFPEEVLLNVNIPDIPLNSVKGCKLTRLGRRDFSKNLQKTSDPRSKERYWIGLPGEPSDIIEGTDFYAIANSYVSISVLTVGRYSENNQAFSAIIEKLNPAG